MRPEVENMTFTLDKIRLNGPKIIHTIEYDF